MKHELDFFSFEFPVHPDIKHEAGFGLWSTSLRLLLFLKNSFLIILLYVFQRRKAKRLTWQFLSTRGYQVYRHLTLPSPRRADVVHGPLHGRL